MKLYILLNAFCDKTLADGHDTGEQQQENIQSLSHHDVGIFREELSDIG